MKRQKRRTRKKTMVLVAALIGLLAIGCVAYAAAPMIRKIFQRNIEQIEQFESRTDEEKFEAELKNIEANLRWHEVHASTEFKGVMISLTDVSFSPDPDSAEGSGRLNICLEYPGMPPFDPNFVDFTARYNGSDYPLIIGDGMVKYRREHEPATTVEDLVEDDWFTNTWYDQGGALTTSLLFAVPDWQLDVSTPMELRATIDGQELAIPFTFDPQLAHEAAVDQARESVIVQETLFAEEKDWLKEWADRSSEVGIAKKNGNHEIILSEISHIEGGLSFTLTLGGLLEEEHDRTFGAYHKKLLWIDGIAVPYGGGQGRTGVEGDIEIIIDSILLNRDPKKLPDESVIYLQYARPEAEPEEFVEFVFRYRWETGEVTVPRDEDEERAWIGEQSALYAENEKVMSQRMIFDLGDQQREFVIDGFKLSVNEIRMESDEIVVDFTYAYEGANDLWVLKSESTLDGRIAEVSSSSSGNGGESIGFLPQDNPVELNDINEFIVDMEVGVYDRKGTVLLTADIKMAFTLDKTTARWEPNPYLAE